MLKSSSAFPARERIFSGTSTSEQKPTWQPIMLTSILDPYSYLSDTSVMKLTSELRHSMQVLPIAFLTSLHLNRRALAFPPPHHYRKRQASPATRIWSQDHRKMTLNATPKLKLSQPSLTTSLLLLTCIVPLFDDPNDFQVNANTAYRFLPICSCCWTGLSRYQVLYPTVQLFSLISPVSTRIDYVPSSLKSFHPDIVVDAHIGDGLEMSTQLSARIPEHYWINRQEVNISKEGKGAQKNAGRAAPFGMSNAWGLWTLAWRPIKRDQPGLGRWLRMPITNYIKARVFWAWFFESMFRQALHPTIWNQLFSSWKVG